jgi:hypothetical protein
MKGLQINLIRAAYCDKAHRRPRDSFGNRLGVDDVALVGFHVWLHELRRHNPDGVPKSHDLPRQPLRPRTRFHANYGWRRPFEELQQRLTPEGRLLNGGARRIEPDDMEDVLADIHAKHGSVTRLVAQAHEIPLLH